MGKTLHFLGKRKVPSGKLHKPPIPSLSSRFIIGVRELEPAPNKDMKHKIIKAAATKVYKVLRVSTKGRANDEKSGLDTQREIIKEYLARNSLPDGEEIVDVGKSAREHLLASWFSSPTIKRGPFHLDCLLSELMIPIAKHTAGGD